MLRQQTRRKVSLLEHVGETAKALGSHLPTSTQSPFYIAGAAKSYEWAIDLIPIEVKACASTVETREE